MCNCVSPPQVLTSTNIIRRMEEETCGEGSVVCVQKYIRRPLLIDRLKVKLNCWLEHLTTLFTLWGVRSVTIFCFVFSRKFLIPIGLHNSCIITIISPTAAAGGTCQKCFTKYHD